MMLSVCPICDEAATAVHHTSEEGLRFSCETCGDFGIADSSAFSMHRYTPKLRQGILQVAVRRAGPGATPFISHID